MKKILYSAFAISLIACSDSANNAPDATATVQETTADCNYAYIADSTTFQWTGYKTTAKIPVKGTFDSIIVAVKEGSSSNSIKAAIQNLEFSIPVNSVNSNNPDRDYKLLNRFFGSMDKTANLTGFVSKLDGNDQNGSIEISINMNGMSQIMTASYAVTDNKFDVVGSLDLLNWKAANAVSSLNDVCKVLHTGEDGISKTWNQVGISFSIAFSEDCK